MPGVGFPLASAWDAYLRGRYAWNERQIASLMQALDYFKRAISIQPLRELTRGSRTRTPSWAPRGTIHRLLRLFPVGRQPFRYAPQRPTTGKVRYARYPAGAGARLQMTEETLVKDNSAR